MPTLNSALVVFPSCLHLEMAVSLDHRTASSAGTLSPHSPPGVLSTSQFSAAFSLFLTFDVFQPNIGWRNHWHQPRDGCGLLIWRLLQLLGRPVISAVRRVRLSLVPR